MGYIEMVENNQLINCDIMIRIYENPMPTLKGKMKRTSPNEHPKQTSYHYQEK